MKKTVRKWFWAWDFDREEKWLNEMAANGLALADIGLFRYTFERSLPGEYNVRLELLENFPSHARSKDYIDFLEGVDVEYIGSITRWVYFRKKTDGGEFNLFSDNSSRIKHLKRLLFLFGTLSLSEFLIGFSIISIYFGQGYTPYLYLGSLCLLLGFLLGYGCLRVNREKKKLKKDLQLFE